MANDARYEDQFSPAERAVRRFARELRWRVKGFLGIQRTILVEMRWRLGDEIMALPVYDALAKRYPRDRLHVLTNYPELFENKTNISAANDASTDPDCYLFLRDDARDAYRPHHYARLAGFAPDAIGRPCLDCSGWISPLERELPEGDGPLVALAPGASWATKRWPTEYWTALAGQLYDAGARVIVVGVKGEGLSTGADFTARTSIRDAAVLLKRVRLLVCCDSGLMHLALAVGTPVVALFGPTAPEALVRNEPIFQAITNGRECAGCWNHGTMKTPGACPLNVPVCMGTIEIGRVIAEAMNTLGPRLS